MANDTAQLAAQPRRPRQADRRSAVRVPASSRAGRIVLLAAAGLLVTADSAQAYIGPGAGIAIGTTLIASFLSFFSVLMALVLWPIRCAARLIRQRRAHAKARIKRFVVLGLDGMEPSLVKKYMAEGKLPNLSRLAESGTFMPLQTTLPPLSPVAWSTFLTGCNPGKHNIFDFLTRDRRTYMPKLSSVAIEEPRRILKLGKYRLPLGKPYIRLLRKGKPFWNVLGEHGIFSNIIRVPITFPPERFRGLLLSAMCVPDLRGSQGTFSYYTTRTEDDDEHTGGERIQIQRSGKVIRSHLVGPENSIRANGEALRCPFTVTPNGDGGAILKVCGQTIELEAGRYTPWVEVVFKAGLGIKIRGICEFLLLSTTPHFEMYVTPIQIDPDKPVLPISHPAVYAAYLSKSQAKFATLGLAEDTWGLNAQILDDETFLHQCLEADSERETMFFDALSKVRRGLCVCVFDGTDRIQHMFWRYIDPKHPARAGQRGAQHRDAIEELYTRMDRLVGRTLEVCDQPGTVLMVLSDHGFKPFRRGVDLNVWLEQNGYLKLKEGGRNQDYLAGVDWSQTQAFGLGLAGIWLNIKGREAQGIVDPKDADALREELCRKLTGLRDEEQAEVAVTQAYNTRECYSGPYATEGPDIIVGYNEGYRVSWEGAIGRPTDKLFHDNCKAWSGDHCVDPKLVPGVLFCNRAINAEKPRLMDIGPTVLDMFGVAPTPQMDGRPLAVADADGSFPSGNGSTAGSGRTLERVAGTLAAIALIVTGSAWLTSCRAQTEPQRKKVIVIGFDGMDPRLCERLMDAGELPNLSKMRDAGGYRRLGTTIPPQSPVAWASFITGANPGVHGIFDFIHRDPAKQCLPYYSAAQTVQGDKGWEVGEHNIPLTFWPFNHAPTQTLLKRHGTPFWDYLDEAGIETRIYWIPANYPPSESRHGHVCCLSGMGVPDLLGTYGTYQVFTEKLDHLGFESGGRRQLVRFLNHAATATLSGPQNDQLKKPKTATVDLQIYRHPTENSARIELQGQTIVLKKGEWSEWCDVEFEMVMPEFLPNVAVRGICRFYLQDVHPEFSLYVTPINIDPADPGSQLISEPPDFVRQISSELGRFYTAGFQEDHQARSNNVFTDREYRQQADYVLGERLKTLAYAKKHYQDGLLFFYFSSTDLQAHIFWWDSDDKHPVRTPEAAKEGHRIIADLYKQMDAVVADIATRYGDEATILVMSDHGFCNFRRQFNLNTWLRDNGYVKPPFAASLLDSRRGALVDWSTTTAYGLGLNGLYLNLAGRERNGVVGAGERDALLREISAKLLQVRDPINGQPVIAEVYRSDEVYSGPHVPEAPDLIIGYHRGYRASWATTLGNISTDVLADNNSAWSADHCVAADQVPGVIFSNRPIKRAEPALVDLAPTILEELGVPAPDTMNGGSLFKPQPAVTATRADPASGTPALTDKE